MWEEGRFEIDDIAFRYQAKVFELPSRHGINNGRISKLEIIPENDTLVWSYSNVIVGYDRAWWRRPETELHEKALDYVLNLYL